LLLGLSLQIVFHRIRKQESVSIMSQHCQMETVSLSAIMRVASKGFEPLCASDHDSTFKLLTRLGRPQHASEAPLPPSPRHPPSRAALGSDQSAGRTRLGARPRRQPPPPPSPQTRVVPRRVGRAKRGVPSASETRRRESSIALSFCAPLQVRHNGVVQLQRPFGKAFWAA
jgi:hypothetical protein